MKTRKLLNLFLILAVLSLGIFALTNRQSIQDWWYLRNYTPTQEITTLADQAGFNQEGEKLFFISDPKINDKQAFKESCPFGEKTIVLGCYDGSNIYILDINDPELEGVEAVTAAHEMLHAAYIRLSEEEQIRVDEMVKKQFEKVDNQRILDLVAEYDSSDQELLSNELHSILPTELYDLDPELEAYYDQYFDDRASVVSAAKNYEAVFIELENETKQLQSQLDSLKSQIKSIESQIATLQDQINTQRNELSRLEAQQEIEEYNRMVPEFNALISEYNGAIAEVKLVIVQHNNVVAQINDVALQQNNLVNTIDSNYSEL